MKIQVLKLAAFGHFTDYEIDFSSSNSNFHIVYGLNEAGKSSTLRAITDFLFGFKNDSRDNFLHEHNRLRVGARLEFSSGEQFEWMRRKGRTKTLSTWNDETPLENDLLQKHLGAVDRELFQSMFGIDHHRLREGGEGLLQTGGKLGELLFSAGAGLSELNKVKAKIQSDHDELIKPTGRSGKIINAVKDLQELRKQQSSALVPVESWNTLMADQIALTKEKNKLVVSIQSFNTQKNRLTRIKDSLPVIAQWKQTKLDLEKLADTNLLPDEFAGRARKASDASLKAEREVAFLQNQIQQTRSLQASTQVDDRILNYAADIRSLNESSVELRKSIAQRPQWLTEQNLALTEIESLLTRLGRDTKEKNLNKLQLPIEKRLRITTLAYEKTKVFEQIKAKETELAKLEKELLNRQKKLDKTTPLKDLALLGSRLEELQLLGDIEKKLGSAIAETEKLRGKCETLASRLNHFEGSLSEANSMKVPSTETIDRFVTLFETLHDERTDAEKSLSGHLKSLGKLQQQLSELEKTDSIPTYEQLIAIRDAREQGWRMLLEHWRRNEASSLKSYPLLDLTEQSLVAQYIDQHAKTSDLPTAYHETVKKADEVADRLRIDADRVAMKATLLKQSLDLELLRDESNSNLQQLRQKIEAAEQEWKTNWSHLHFEPLPPKEMREWTRKLAELRSHIDVLMEQEAEINRQRDGVQSSKQSLLLWLNAIGLSLPEGDYSLRELVIFARDQYQKNTATETERKSIEAAIEETHEEIVSTNVELAQLNLSISQYNSEWSELMRLIHISDDCSPDQALAVIETLDSIAEQSRIAETRRNEISILDNECALLEASVRQTLANALPETKHGSVEATLQQLTEKLHQNEKANQQNELAKKQLIKLENDLTTAQSELIVATDAINQLLIEAGCEDQTKLFEVAEKSKAKKNLERLLDSLQLQILRFSDGQTIPEYVDSVDDYSSDQLITEIESIDSQITDITTQRDEIIRKLSVLEEQLRKIDGESKAAEIAENAESMISQIEDDLRKYTVLRVASTALKIAIERHREKNKGPIINRASSLFAKMTCNVFTGLDIDIHSEDPVLSGVRSQDNSLVNVEGMSDGTCDQLYLALRLASLESWLEKHESLPFIIDDVLLNFDDQRSIATLQILQELSNKTQIIFFTHHQHLVDLAMHSIPSTPPALHALSSR